MKFLMQGQVKKFFKAKSMQICVDINTRESVYTAPLNFVKKLEAYA